VPQRLVDGENPISFCNVFFLAQMIVGPGGDAAWAQAAGPRPSPAQAERSPAAAVDAFLGLFLGPVAYYFALSSLSVISQTLIFALVLPVSALLAQRLLAEPLPDGFGVSFGLIGLGLLLANLAGGAVGGGGMGAAMDNLAGVSWALLGVLAFSGAAVTGRRIASKRLVRGAHRGPGLPRERPDLRPSGPAAVWAWVTSCCCSCGGWWA